MAKWGEAFARSYESSLDRTQKGDALKRQFELEEDKMAQDKAFKEVEMERLNRIAKVEEEQKNRMIEISYDTQAIQATTQFGTQYVQADPNNPYIKGKYKVFTSEEISSLPAFARAAIPKGGYWIDSQVGAFVAAQQNFDKVGRKQEADLAKLNEPFRLSQEIGFGLANAPLVERVTSQVPSHMPYKESIPYDRFGASQRKDKGPVTYTEKSYLKPDVVAARANAIAELYQKSAAAISSYPQMNNDPNLQEVRTSALQLMDQLAQSKQDIPYGKTAVAVFEQLKSQREAMRGTYNAMMDSEQRLIESKKSGLSDEAKEEQLKLLEQSRTEFAFDQWFKSQAFNPRQENKQGKTGIGYGPTKF